MIEQKTAWEILGISKERWFNKEVLEGEEWKDISDLDGKYQISSFGRVKSLSRVVNLETAQGVKERIRVLGTNPKGYSVISLCFGHCKMKTFTVHRVVANAFIPNISNLPEINHKNLIKQDNRVINLEWVTSKQNTNHSWRFGNRKAASCETHGMASLTNDQVKIIRNLYTKNNITQIKLAEMFSTRQGVISSIVNYKTWKKI